MSGQQAYIYQANNRLLNSVITAVVNASEKKSIVVPVIKQGNGNVRIFGDYTGQDDALYDVKIYDSVLNNPHVSAPQFYGAGSGKISDISVNNLASQTITVLCVSTGTDTENALINIEGLVFRAKTAGVTGNNIYIVIDDSGLVFTETDYTLLKDLAVGATGLNGQEYDFDTKTLTNDLVPEDAHRIRFGQNKKDIYVQYKKYVENQWEYHFIPDIIREVKAGEKVYNVTGSRTITVTDGITSETYTKIVTPADFWSKVKATSTLLEPVASSIDLTRAVDSPATKEMLTKTDAYFLPPYADTKNSEYANELIGIGVTNSAHTELIKITCKDNTFMGAEIWTVVGSSSGDHGEVLTGSIFNNGLFSFTIPSKVVVDGTVVQDWSYETEWTTRGEGVDDPMLCFDMRLGIYSQPQTLTLTYRRRPEYCFCPPVTFSDKCLGFDTEGGEITMAYTVPDLKYWTDAQIQVMLESFITGSEYSERGMSDYAYFKRQLADEDQHANLIYEQNLKPLFDRYGSLFKDLAQRLMNLPEDDPATLQSMVDSYKNILDTVQLVVGSNTSTWNGTSWSTGYAWFNQWTMNSGNVDFRYSTSNFQALVDSCLLYERTYGIKKNRVVSGNNCYVENLASTYYWEVSGNKAYLPAYTDIPYYSTIKTGNEYEATKEFAFLISLPCGGSGFLEGDKIIVTIGQRDTENTYQVGDVIYLPTIASQNLYCSGGVDGDDLYTFEITSETDVFADYLLNRDTPASYTSSKLNFLITEGVVPFSVGDYFDFDIEGGRFIWRKDSGAWSSPVNISKELQDLDAGLRILFEFGVAPSFEINDTWQIKSIQSNKISNGLNPLVHIKTKGTGTIVIDAGSSVAIDSLIIDYHNLTSAFDFIASDSPSFSPAIYTQNITPTAIICDLPSTVTARYFKLDISGSFDIGYLFLGLRMQLSLDADKIEPLRRYNMKRQEKKEPFSLHGFTQKGYSVQHKSFIYNDDFNLLETMLNYLKQNGDLPFYFIPNINYSAECIRARIESDNVEFESPMDMNAPQANRLFAVTLPVVGSVE
jgi:hypothetical protein